MKVLKFQFDNEWGGLRDTDIDVFYVFKYNIINSDFRIGLFDLMTDILDTAENGVFVSFEDELFMFLGSFSDEEVDLEDSCEYLFGFAVDDWMR